MSLFWRSWACCPKITRWHVSDKVTPLFIRRHGLTIQTAAWLLHRDEERHEDYTTQQPLLRAGIEKNPSPTRKFPGQHKLLCVVCMINLTRNRMIDFNQNTDNVGSTIKNLTNYKQPAITMPMQHVAPNATQMSSTKSSNHTQRVYLFHKEPLNGIHPQTSQDQREFLNTRWCPPNYQSNQILKNFGSAQHR